MIKIREMRPSDLDAVLRIRLEWLSLQFEATKTTELERAWFSRYPGNASALALLAVDSDQIVGYLLCALASHPTTVGRSADIDEVCVVPSHRRQGIGSRLVDELRGRLRASVDDLTTIRARTDREDARAQAFAKSLGFEHHVLQFTEYLE